MSSFLPTEMVLYRATITKPTDELFILVDGYQQILEELKTIGNTEGQMAVALNKSITDLLTVIDIRSGQDGFII
jgi:hypothetical protein